jgi:myo-inositol-1(or 4)-monophosphatase
VGDTALELMAVAQRAADAGARVAMRWQEGGDLRVEEKAGPRDLVSQADRESEDAIAAVLSRLRPDDSVLGEERGATAGRSEVTWAVDPIDGTTNYLYGRPDWAVSVAALSRLDQRVLAAAVAEPALGRMTTAAHRGGTWSQGRRTTVRARAALDCALIEVNLGTEDQRDRAGAMIGALAPHARDIRRGGSAAAALAQVATGRADAVWAPGLQPWDGAAGVLLVHEAGGTVGDLSGDMPACWPPSGDVLASAPQLWAPLRRLLAPVYGVVV